MSQYGLIADTPMYTGVETRRYGGHPEIVVLESFTSHCHGIIGVNPIITLGTMSLSVLPNLSFRSCAMYYWWTDDDSFLALSVSVYRPALNDFHILSSWGEETS